MSETLNTEIQEIIQSLFGMRIQQKRDTSRNWGNNNPVLLDGEIGIETDTGRFKIGNGHSNWNDLKSEIVPTVSKTLNEWNNNSNLILLNGQIGLVRDRDDIPQNGRFKIGDGQSKWNELPYAAVAPKDIQTLMTFRGVKSTYNELPSATDNSIGDVWNVSNEGVNYVWVGFDNDYDPEDVDNQTDSRKDGWEQLGYLFEIQENINVNGTYIKNPTENNQPILTKNPVSEEAVYRFFDNYLTNKEMIQEINPTTVMMDNSLTGIYRITSTYNVYYGKATLILQKPLLFVFNSTYKQYVLLGCQANDNVVYICYTQKQNGELKTPWKVNTFNYMIEDIDGLNSFYDMGINCAVDQSVIKWIYDTLNWNKEDTISEAIDDINNTIDSTEQDIQDIQDEIDTLQTQDETFQNILQGFSAEETVKNITDALNSRIEVTIATDLNNCQDSNKIYYFNESTTNIPDLTDYYDDEIQLTENRYALPKGLCFVSNQINESNGDHYIIQTVLYGNKIFKRDLQWHDLNPNTTATEWREYYASASSVQTNSNDITKINNKIYVDYLDDLDKYPHTEQKIGFFNSNTKNTPQAGEGIVFLLNNGVSLVSGNAFYQIAITNDGNIYRRAYHYIEGQGLGWHYGWTNIIENFVNNYHPQGSSPNNPIDFSKDNTVNIMANTLNNLQTVGTYYYKLNQNQWNHYFSAQNNTTSGVIFNSLWETYAIDTPFTTRIIKVEVEHYYTGENKIDANDESRIISANVTDVCQKISIGASNFIRVHKITDSVGIPFNGWTYWSLINPDAAAISINEE